MTVASTRARALARRCFRHGAAFVFIAVLLGGAFDATPAFAQTDFLTFPKRSRPAAKPTLLRSAGGGQQQMLVQATELHYDYVNERVSAVGNVQIYHAGATVEADRVIYDQRAKRLRAEGNVRLTEADGKITYGEILELNEDFRDGFVDSLRLDTADQTRLAAARGDRSGGNYTVLQSGVYTACLPCEDDPKKPPLWQIKAARIIHHEGEKMIYFENGSLEFFGLPLVYFPYLSAPDPTVKRKTGFLMPNLTAASPYGFGIETPYFLALAPDYDLTLSPMITTKQGPLLEAEFRQRLVNGSYMIRAAGIFQLDKDYFLRTSGPATPGYRTFRGSLESSGQFALNQKWVWGWDAVLLSDQTFFQDYNRPAYSRTLDPFQTGLTAGVSQIYLTGKGDRSFFDIRAIHYYGFSEADVQRQIPLIHPVMDYSYIVGQPVLGGELGYRFNLTSLTRSAASFDPISSDAFSQNFCLPATADPAVKIPANCLLRGIPGTYSRFSAEMNWRRTIIDSFGQMFTPFASVRADASTMSIGNDPGVANFISPGNSSLVRGTPTIGLEYRYPFISVHSWGTQTIEPIAQIIASPSETNIGKLPNEDSQSLIFDDGNLFRVNKFSGWDRIEGGGRANAGVQYTAQFNNGGFVNALFGQSYHLFGVNSFAGGDITNTGLNSGLETDRSDYVARVSYQPDRIYTFSMRYRFDESTLAIRRFEVEARVNLDRWSTAVLYGNYDRQPELGFLTRREGVLASTSLKLARNWVLRGAARYDIDAAKFDQTTIGAGYIDDCLILALNYITSYNYNGQTKADHRVMLQFSLRTLGGTAMSTAITPGMAGLPGAH